MPRFTFVAALTGAALAAGSPPPNAATAAAAPSAGSSVAVLQGIPGMDFSILPEPAQRELAQVMTDEFCYCGCPHTLAACLKTHGGCKHAKRMAKLAAGEAAAGASSAEIMVQLERYYQGFREGRQSLKIDPRQCTGASDAKVTVVDFADFECPFCGAARPILEQFAKDNAAKVRLCYAPYPLSMHANAIPAGQAALYARDHGKFWAMHDALFENQTRLSVDFIKELAGKLGLSGAELGKVFASNKYVEELNAFKEMGKAASVVATPILFINGKKHDLPLTQENLSQAVDDESEWMAHQNAWASD